jgi:hypothetical protein
MYNPAPLSQMLIQKGLILTKERYMELSGFISEHRFDVQKRNQTNTPRPST